MGTTEILHAPFLLQSDIDSMVGDMPHSFVEARVAALETIMTAATSPEEVLLITTGKSRCLEAIRKSMSSASPEVPASSCSDSSSRFIIVLHAAGRLVLGPLSLTRSTM